MPVPRRPDVETRQRLKPSFLASTPIIS